MENTKDQEPLTIHFPETVNEGMEMEKNEIVEQKETSILTPMSLARAQKIIDPERKSKECISNGFSGCQMEELLQKNIERFLNKKKQVIVLTAAGKPVYSYHQEDDLAKTTGIIQALNANFSSMGETLKSMESDNGFFVFERIKELLFFCYAPKEATTVLLIHEEFQLLYQQIVILLSNSAMDMLKRKQNYDIQELLGNSANSLATIINEDEISLYTLLHCYQPLLLPPSFRNMIKDVFMKYKQPNTIYAGMGINQRVILLLQNKQFQLKPINEVLLLSMITQNATYRSSEGWVPICITDVQESSFLHLYVGYMTDDIYIFFITAANNPDDFVLYSQIKENIYTMLLDSNRIVDMYSSYNNSISVIDVGIPELIHFAIKDETSQILLPKMNEALYDYSDYRNLIKEYQLIYSYMMKNNLNEYYVSNAEHIIHAAKIGTSFFMVVFGPYLPIKYVTEKKNTLKEWLAKKVELMIQKTQMYW